MLKVIMTVGGIQVFAIVLNLLRSKILAVLLGPSGVGVISLIDQVVQFIAYVSTLSVPFAAVKFLSRAHSTSPREFQDTYSGFLRLLLLLTGAGALIGLGLVHWRPDLLEAQLGVYRPLLIPALLGLPAMGLLGLFGGVLAAAQKVTAAALLTFGTALVFAVSAFVGVSLGGPAGLYWGNLFAGGVMVAAALRYLRATLHLPIRPVGRGVIQQLRHTPEAIGFALTLYVVAVLTSLAYFVVRYAVLTRFGPAQAGLLQAVLALSGSVGLVLSPANGLYLTPILNRDIPREDKIRTVLEYQRKLMLVLSALAMAIALFPQALLTVLYTPSFAVAGSVVFLFVVAQCLLRLAGVYHALLIGFDNIIAYGVVDGTGYALLAILAWLLVPRYGLVGVGVASLVAGGSSLLLAQVYLLRRQGLALPRRLAVTTAYGLAVPLLAGAAFHSFGAWQVLPVLSKAGVYLLFLVSLRCFLSRQEAAALVAGAGRLLGLRSDRASEPLRARLALPHAAVQPVTGVGDE